MKKFLMFVLVCLSFLLIGCTEEVSFSDTNNFKTLNKPNENDKTYVYYGEKLNTTYLSTFANETFKRLYGGKDNIIYSPISLYYVLGMLLNGAEGETEEELCKLMTLGAEGTMDKDDVNELVLSIYNHNQYENNLGKMKLANSVWVNKNFDVKSEYIDTLSKYYNPGVYQTNFESSGKKNICKWINKNTDNLLDYKVDDVDADGQTMIMLINTTLFNNKWKYVFTKNNSFTDLFYGDSNTNVNYKSHKIDTSLYENDDYIIVHDYFENKNKIRYIMPKGNKTIKDLIDSNIIAQEFEYTSKYIQLSVPNFKTKSGFLLNEMISDLGAGNIFNTNKANFSKISKQKIYIEKIIQDAFIELNEEGVKAAAVTIATSTCSSANPNVEQEVVLNKPFIYCIYDESDVPLFVGAIKNIEE